jgi:hypothetical protein
MKKLLLTTAFAAICTATAANATLWTVWDGNTAVLSNTAGSATGVLGGVTVTYSGENQGVNQYSSNWSPATTWEGGAVTNAPPDNSGIRLFGSYGANDTVTFSSAVLNPVLAIVSLGQGGLQASFDFTGNGPFGLYGGGPSSAWGGVPLTSSGSVVYGVEGNGLVQFYGSYTSITWTNPTYENYYAVTVGTVPEISTWAMLLLGFGGLGFLGYQKSSKASSASA